MSSNSNSHEVTPLMDSSCAQNQRGTVRLAALLWDMIKVTLLRTKVNALLFCLPVGLLAGMAKWDPVVVFGVNFFAIIPLADILSNATENLSTKLGGQLGGLLNATLGNAVELIVSFVALRKKQYAVAKSSMIGSILSNLLLVMGMCFFFGGIKNMKDTSDAGTEQTFANITAQTTCSLLMLAAASMVVPSALSVVMQSSPNNNPDECQQAILYVSRGTAIVLFIMYIFYLYFSLRTHHNLFVPKNQRQSSSNLGGDEEQAEGFVATQAEGGNQSPKRVWSAVSALVVTTVLIAICAHYLVNSIDALVERVHLSRNFVGLILIPIVGNAAEHATAVIAAFKNNMDLACAVHTLSS
ncbi:Calcium/proton exchanger [Apiospora arundinis]|uniref:Vacuolar calcium ion transporter n=1 Tax=Apiospora arundinis TaxID=335852 RepID=A0ABR2I9N0_9PEZI